MRFLHKIQKKHLYNLKKHVKINMIITNQSFYLRREKLCLDPEEEAAEAVDLEAAEVSAAVALEAVAIMVALEAVAFITALTALVVPEDPVGVGAGAGAALIGAMAVAVAWGF